MEAHINRIELLGRVGSVRINEINGKKVANFSLATEVFIKKASGQILCETTWHNITSWEGNMIADFSRLQKGSLVKVQGRLRNTRYTGDDGIERTYPEILAHTMDIH